MAQKSIFHLGLSGILMFLFSVCASGSFIVDGLSSYSSLPGNSIEIVGEGFSTDDTYTVTLSGVSVAVTNISETAIRFTVPADVSSGQVVLSDGEQSVSHPFPFFTRRAITGEFHPPLGVTRSGYEIFDGDKLNPINADGTFSADIITGVAKLMWAVREEDDPYFLVMVLPGDDHVIIDARSTAQGEIFLFPELMTTNPTRVEQYLEYLAEAATFDSYANRLAAVSADGSHFLNDATFSQLQIDVATELIDALVADQSAQLLKKSQAVKIRKEIDFPDEDPYAARALTVGVPGGALMRDFSPNWMETRIPPITPHLFDSTLSVSEDDPENYFIFKLYDKNSSPTDAVVELWEVDPASVGGFEEFIALRSDQTLTTLGDKPLNTGYSRASLFFNLVDQVETVSATLNSYFNPAKYFGSFFGYGNDDLAADAFRIDRNKPAVYVVRVYSGCINHTYINALRDQLPMINELDSQGAYAGAIKINMIIAAINLAGGTGLDPSKLTKWKEGGAKAGLLDATFGDVTKQVTAIIGGQGLENLDERAIMDTIKAAAEAIIETSISSSLKKFANASNNGLDDKLGKLGKAANLLQVGERAAKMILPYQLALERKIIVIGDPFRPTITYLSTLQGRDGDLLKVFGNNFGLDPSEVTVSFANFTGPIDDDPLTPLPIDTTTEIVVPIVEDTLSDENFKVVIPDAFDHFVDNKAAIVLTLASSGKQTTLMESGELVEFSFLAPGEVNRVEPETLFNSKVLTLHGSGFDHERPSRYSVKVNGLAESAQIPSMDAYTINLRLLADNLPVNQALSLELFYRDKLVGSKSFEIFVPTTSVGSNGISAQITKADFSNAQDGEISIFEAFALANGTLGRGVQLRPDDPNVDPFPITRFESDFVGGLDEFGRGGGPNFKDYIGTHNDVKGSDVTLSSALPEIKSGDQFTLEFNIHAVGLAEPVLTFTDQHQDITITELIITNSGIVFNNCSSITLDIDLENSPGDGVQFIGGATGNRYSGTINSPAGNGVRIFQANANILDGVAVNNAGEHGVFLSEASNNSLNFLEIDGPAQHGLYLLGPECDYNSSIFPSSSPVGGGTYAKFINSANGYGIVLENGAEMNQIEFGQASGNALGGILVTGADTQLNTIGENDEIRPGLHLVENNGGDGVLINAGADNNLVRWLAISNNRGNGIKLDDVSNTRVDSTFTYVEGDASGMLGYNDENGILITGDSKNNLIGSKALSSNSSFGLKSTWAANRLSGVVLDGPEVAFNTVNRARVGDAFPYSFFVQSQPNGEHGLVLRNGAHDNVIGDTNAVLDLEFFDVPNGACILIEGSDTRNNRVIGNQIGSAHAFVEFDFTNNIQLRPKIGIHIRDGARGNIIGDPGDITIGGPNPTPSHFGNQDQPYNVITNCTEAGILIENAGTLAEPNIIRNNRIGEQEGGTPLGNFVGIRITGSGYNIIGGELPGRGNLIQDSVKAGIWLDHVTGAFDLSTRIVDNDISFNLGDLSDPDNPDPTVGPVNGTGILVTGSSALQVGKDLTRANEIYSNIVGVHIDNAFGHELIGNEIFNNEQAGVVVTNSAGNTIGSNLPGRGNRILGNGEGGAEDAGIIIANSTDERISANLIGDDGVAGPNLGNDGAGIRVVDSTGVRIGGSAVPEGNQIIHNTGAGIRLENADQTIIQNNLIGVDLAMNSQANGSDGILIESGSQNNIIGGRIPTIRDGQRTFDEAPNQIGFNAGAGVQVAAGATGNQILSNVIFNNLGKGIALVGGGNSNQLAPANATFVNGRIQGTVSIGQIPVGSTIQAFSNFAAGQDEGEITLGTGTVLTGGTFDFPIGIYPTVNGFTLTATNVNTQETSEFSVPSSYDIPTLVVSREGDPQAEELPIENMVAVFPFRVSANGSLMRISELTVEVSGTALDNYDFTNIALYEDAGGGGLNGASELATGSHFETEDGTFLLFTFEDGGVSIATGETQNWLIGLELTPAVPDPIGSTLQLEIPSTSFISARAVLLGAAITPLGVFPIESDQYTTIASPLALATADAFGEDADNPLIAGPLVDYDGDGVPNIIELLLGTDPTMPDSGAGFLTEETEEGQLAITFVRAPGADFEIVPEVSADLAVWSTGRGIIERIEESANGDGSTNVKIIFKPIVADFGGLFGRIAVPIN